MFSALSDVYLLWKLDASGSFAQNGGNAVLLPPGLYPADETANMVKSSLGIYEAVNLGLVSDSDPNSSLHVVPSVAVPSQPLPE